MPIPPDWADRLNEVVSRIKAGQPKSHDEFLGDAPFDNFVLTEEAKSWDSFLSWLNELHGCWCFRGQREAEWLLHTSLDRAVRREHSSTDDKGYHHEGYYHLDRETEGRDLLFRFQQQAHNYVAHFPANGDLASWFALMQHHGAPTRLLDWTDSPYVAAYFAFEEEAAKSSSAVWAINLDWLEAATNELLREVDRETSVPDDPSARAAFFNELLGPGELGVIIRISPLEASQRMVAQQGLFLCKLFHQATFNQVLMRMMVRHEAPKQPVVRKLVIGTSVRIEFLKRLQAMNIHRASLFPGLDGFGTFLKQNLEIKVKGGEK